MNNATHDDIVSWVTQRTWSKVVSRPLSLFELSCSAQAYTALPLRTRLDSLVLSREGVATRYCLPSQLAQLAAEIRASDPATLLADCMAADTALGELLRKPFADIDPTKFIRLYVESWKGELLGYYIGEYSERTTAHETATQLRGTHNAQHIAATQYVPQLLAQTVDDHALTPEEATCLLPEEITSGTFSRVDLRARYREYVLVTRNNTIELLSDTAGNATIAAHLETESAEPIPSTTTTLHGSTAYPGTAQGTVCLVHKEADMHKLHDGDILVSVMTRTTLLPAMKKAAAIVTDEGGVTCHAAIVAREMKKPCIIGTKIATQILKDGDVVEVDAEHGEVRIVERAGE